jgi:hypothetical protein
MTQCLYHRCLLMLVTLVTACPPRTSARRELLDVPTTREQTPTATPSFGNGHLCQLLAAPPLRHLTHPHSTLTPPTPLPPSPRRRFLFPHSTLTTCASSRSTAPSFFT